MIACIFSESFVAVALPGQPTIPLHRALIAPPKTYPASNGE
jgi:hypothetical protein